MTGFYKDEDGYIHFKSSKIHYYILKIEPLDAFVIIDSFNDRIINVENMLFYGFTSLKIHILDENPPELVKVAKRLIIEEIEEYEKAEIRNLKRYIELNPDDKDRRKHDEEMILFAYSLCKSAILHYKDFEILPCQGKYIIKNNINNTYVASVYNGKYTFVNDYLYAKDFSFETALKHKEILEKGE